MFKFTNINQWFYFTFWNMHTRQKMIIKMFTMETVALWIRYEQNVVYLHTLCPKLQQKSFPSSLLLLLASVLFYVLNQIEINKFSITSLNVLFCYLFIFCSIRFFFFRFYCALNFLILLWSFVLLHHVKYTQRFTDGNFFLSISFSCSLL